MELLILIKENTIHGFYILEGIGLSHRFHAILVILERNYLAGMVIKKEQSISVIIREEIDNKYSRIASNANG